MATLYVVSGSGNSPNILKLLTRFETLHADMPENKKQAMEMTLDSIRIKVVAICDVRCEIKTLRGQEKERY